MVYKENFPKIQENKPISEINWNWKELIEIIIIVAIFVFSLMFIEIYITIWELLTLWRVPHLNPHLNHAWYTRKIPSKYKKTNQYWKLIWNWEELIQNVIVTIHVFSLIFIELYDSWFTSTKHLEYPWVSVRNRY